MHRAIKERLEEFLAGTDDVELLKEFEAHLQECDECFQIVQLMREQTRMLRDLKAPGVFTPQPGFHARVMQRIEAEPKPSFWNIFLDPSFGKRLMYATATLLVLLGTYLVSGDSGERLTAASSPEAVLAVETQPANANVGQEAQRDAILVNLATFQEQ